MSVDWSKVQWYSRSRGPIDAGPTVAISKSGRTVINQEAMQVLGETPEAFQVGIIPGARGKVTLVLQGAAKSDAGALSVTKQGTSKFSVNTTRFFREVGLEKLFGTAQSTPDVDRERHALVVPL